VPPRRKVTGQFRQLTHGSHPATARVNRGPPRRPARWAGRRPAPPGEGSRTVGEDPGQ